MRLTSLVLLALVSFVVGLGSVCANPKSTYWQSPKGTKAPKEDFKSFAAFKAELAKFKKVVVLTGWSAIGYGNKAQFIADIARLVRYSGDDTAFVTGGTTDGIGGAYEVIPVAAKQHGFKHVGTFGIVSSQSLEYGGYATQDHLLIVESEDWEVRDGDKSLTVTAATLGASGQKGGILVALEGGDITEKETRESVSRKIPVLLISGYEPANLEKFEKKGKPRAATKLAAEFANNPLVKTLKAGFGGSFDML